MPISLTIAFVPNYTTFTILRFLLGVWLQVSLNAYSRCKQIKFAFPMSSLSQLF